MKTAAGAVESTHHHAVQFYGTDESLFTTVAGFLAEGLAAHQPAIIIATAPHRRAIVEHLCGRSIDCKKATHDGDLLLLDAEETLDLFMADGSPDPLLFADNVGRLIEQALNGRSRVVLRAYGEMVDVLWKRGRPDAAIELEILWNKLALKYQFGLLCGYAMGSFYKQTPQRQELEAICAQHSHVIPAGASVVPFERRSPDP
jgi:hypothetical protein